MASSLSNRIARFHEACKQFESSTDANLPSYFSNTAAIDEVANFDSPKALAVGLKGIGKTAAFRYFSEFGKGPDVVIGINKDRFSLHLLNKNLNYATCCKQFEHDIVLEALRAVHRSRKTLSKKLNGSLVDSAAKQVASYTDTLKALAARFSGASILGFGFTLSKSDTPVVIGLREDAEILEAFRTLEEICKKGVKIRIVVDDPEQVFSASRDLDTHLVGGFCLAALRLSHRIRGLKIIPLLKTHVYYPVLIDVDDLRKYPDHMARLCWFNKELIDVVDSRMYWAGVVYTDVFEGTDKQARKILEDMSSSIRNGPRDLLRWIDLCLQATKGARIANSTVQQTKKRMSVDSLGELASAHSGKYPKIAAVIRTIFRDSPTRKFKRRELGQHIQNLLIKDPEMKSISKLPWMQIESSQTLVELLFETGAIALETGGTLTLPFQEGYDAESFETADTLVLVPALIEAVTK